jgi:predicted amidohydrolase
MSTVKVGLVQMTCTADKEQNLQKAIGKVRKLFAYRNYSPRFIFAMRKITTILN